jgi:hypothetical protein
MGTEIEIRATVDLPPGSFPNLRIDTVALNEDERQKF